MALVSPKPEARLLALKSPFSNPRPDALRARDKFQRNTDKLALVLGKRSRSTLSETQTGTPASQRSVEEIELEKTALRTLVDTQSRRLQMWELGSQSQSLPSLPSQSKSTTSATSEKATPSWPMTPPLRSPPPSLASGTPQPLDKTYAPHARSQRTPSSLGKKSLRSFESSSRQGSRSGTPRSGSQKRSPSRVSTLGRHFEQLSRGVRNGTNSREARGRVANPEETSDVFVRSIRGRLQF